MLSKKEISKLPEDSAGIYKSNTVNRYLIRSSDVIIQGLCYASLKNVMSFNQNKARMIPNLKN